MPPKRCNGQRIQVIKLLIYSISSIWPEWLKAAIYNTSGRSNTVIILLSSWHSPWEASGPHLHLIDWWRLEGLRWSRGYWLLFPPTPHQPRNQWKMKWKWSLDVVPWERIKCSISAAVESCLIMPLAFYIIMIFSYSVAIFPLLENAKLLTEALLLLVLINLILSVHLRSCWTQFFILCFMQILS